MRWKRATMMKSRRNEEMEELLPQFNPRHFEIKKNHESFI